MSGLSDSTFRRREHHGQIIGEVHGGSKWYHPEHVLKLAGIDAAETESIQERAQLLTALKTSHEHVEELLKLVTEPARTANRHYEKLVRMMSKRQRKMDRRFMNTMDLVETVVSAQHEREQDAAREERRANTAHEGFELAKKFGPRVIDGLAKVNSVKDFFGSLREEQLGALSQEDEQGGFLDEHQRSALREILERFKEKEGDDDDGTDETGAEETRARSVGQESVSVPTGGRGAAEGSDGGREDGSGGGAPKRRRPKRAAAKPNGAGDSGDDGDGAPERPEGVSK